MISAFHNYALKSVFSLSKQVVSIMFPQLFHVKQILSSQKNKQYRNIRWGNSTDTGCLSDSCWFNPG